MLAKFEKYLKISMGIFIRTRIFNVLNRVTNVTYIQEGHIDICLFTQYS